ncbi:ras guanine nucleotide exchange factor i-related [Anaeramoeba flamelloides]|uniref:Ras guanine nucleotide exchange factor i-related n=1 Tax=Anaeramoeba flamelloides TaxID=1746091 RepID=A0ABQ8XDG0_9EUKA|nr:ras guanine nucleotide exchange factor i-related [Anaeramoeba flamelloides]
MQEQNEKNQKQIIPLTEQLKERKRDEKTTELKQLMKEVEDLSNSYQKLRNEIENKEKEQSNIRKQMNSTRIEYDKQIEILKEKISLYDREITRDSERRKKFGETGNLFQKGAKEFEKKIQQLEKELITVKKKILDLELGKEQFQMKIESVIEYRDDKLRRDWTYRVLTKYPEITNLRERINPLSRAISLASIYAGSKIGVKSLLTKTVVNQLIMQHYDFEGKSLISRYIENSTATLYPEVNLSESRLLLLLRMAIRDSETLYDLLMSGNNRKNISKEQQMNVIAGTIDEIGLEMIDENDLDIWKEPPDNPSNIVYHTAEQEEILQQLQQQDKQRESQQKPEKQRESHNKSEIPSLDLLHCANINKLVEKLTSDQSTVQYRNTFIMTYQSFMTPLQLLNKLKQRYNVPAKKEGEDEMTWKKNRDFITIRVISALKNWIETEFNDIDEKIVEKLKDFIRRVIKPEKERSATSLLNAIKDQREKREKQSLLRTTEQAPPPIVPKNIFHPKLSLSDICEEEFARQLTLLVSDLFRKIKPSELAKQQWTKKKPTGKVLNIVACFNKFNGFGRYIATEIVTPKTVKERAKAWQRFAKMGKHFLELSNFDSLMATIAGLSNNGVRRLKQTHQEIPKHFTKMFNEAKIIMDQKNGYHVYRERLEQARLDGPAMPYLGVWLTDITRISSGSSNTIKGLINFSKRKQLYNIISQIQEYQNLRYHFQSVYQIQMLLKRELPHKNDKELYKISVSREKKK